MGYRRGYPTFLSASGTEFVFYVSLPVQYFCGDKFREHMMQTDFSSSNSHILFRAHFCINGCIVYSIPYLGHLLKGPALHLQLDTCHLVKKKKHMAIMEFVEIDVLCSFHDGQF